MEIKSIHPEQLDALLITHEHGDHVNGLDLFAAKFNVPVYANEGTAEVCERQIRSHKHTPPEFAVFQSRVPFALGELTITPVPISHDVAEAVAYTLEEGAAKLGYFTDLGFVSEEVSTALSGCTALILESNHDLELLRTSGRPWNLVSRISGEVGHLSNEQACEAIANHCPETLKTLLLAHLSHDCNDPELALSLMRATLQSLGREEVQLAIAAQEVPSAFFSL